MLMGWAALTGQVQGRSLAVGVISETGSVCNGCLAASTVIASFLRVGGGMKFSRTPSLGPVRVRGFHAFHAREEQQLPVRAIVEGDLFRSARSSFLLLLLLSHFFFFSHPESCLKIKVFARKSDVSGRREGDWGRGGEGGGATGWPRGGPGKKKTFKKK